MSKEKINLLYILAANRSNKDKEYQVFLDRGRGIESLSEFNTTDIEFLAEQYIGRRLIQDGTLTCSISPQLKGKVAFSFKKPASLPDIVLFYDRKENKKIIAADHIEELNETEIKQFENALYKELGFRQSKEEG